MASTAKQQPSRPDRWEMKIGRSVYGPYTREEMESLATQGLLAPHSRIAKHGSRNWNRASADPVIGEIFGRKFRDNTQQATDQEAAAEAQATNFALFLEIASDSNIDLFQAIRNLGPSSRISRSCWLVKSERSAAAIRNALIPLMANADSLLVVDTSKSKLAWFNLGPEADSKIRKVWD